MRGIVLLESMGWDGDGFMIEVEMKAIFDEIPQKLNTSRKVQHPLSLTRGSFDLIA